MPPEPPAHSIVSPGNGNLADQLWRILDPRRWPLDPAQLPAGSALVGGAVRDALLGRLADRPDLDFVVEVEALQLARDLAGRFGGQVVVLDQERSIARLVLRGWNIDLARRMGPDLEADLQRRDYTVNAIALPTDGHSDPRDPCGGLTDLCLGRLRAISLENLLEDPLRLLRGPRLACELGFALEARTQNWIRSEGQQLTTVAGERVLAELERLAQAPNGSEGLRRTLELGLLDPWQPEPEDAIRALSPLMPARLNDGGLKPEEQAGALPLARLAAILPATGLQRLRSSRRLQQRCTRLQHWQRRLKGEHQDGIPAGALERLPETDRLDLQRDLEQDWPALALQLDPADARASLGRWRDGDDPLFHPRPPLDGRVLQQELGLTPGPGLGKLLAHLMQERAFGRLESDGDPLKALLQAQQWLTIHAGSDASASQEGPSP